MLKFLNRVNRKVRTCTLLLFVLAFVVSCGPPYDGDVIVEIENEFFNSSNEPIAGLAVEYQVSRSYGTDDSFSFVTDENGAIRFSIFNPRGDFRIYTTSFLENSRTFTMAKLKPDRLNSQRFYVLAFDEVVYFELRFSSSNFQRSISNIELSGIGNYAINRDDPEVFNLELKKNQTITISYTVFDSYDNSSETFSIVREIGTNDISETLQF
ncbi:hypothetical protein [Flavobacterium sp.]|uniref:hypothetical protein n=1 Tax=Flavobacterium sp. TaxID=239 RepID=UPI003B9C39A7